MPPPVAIGVLQNPPINLLSHYGQVSIAQVRAHATAYMIFQETAYQQSGMLYKFLKNSISAEAHNILDINADNYTINGQKDGVCYLK
jgi:hypothetical protein